MQLQMGACNYRRTFSTVKRNELAANLLSVYPFPINHIEIKWKRCNHLVKNRIVLVAPEECQQKWTNDSSPMKYCTHFHSNINKRLRKLCTSTFVINHSQQMVRAEQRRTMFLLLHAQQIMRNERHFQNGKLKWDLMIKRMDVWRQ